MPSSALSYVHIDDVCTAMIGLEHTSDDVSATGIILITTHILKNLGMQLLCTGPREFPSEVGVTSGVAVSVGRAAPASRPTEIFG